MSELPRYLFRNFSAWLDKESYLGQCSEIELPMLKAKTEEILNGGMVLPVEVILSYEKLEAKAKLTSFDPRALALFGLKFGTLRSYMFAGAFVDEVDGTTHSAVVSAFGFVHQLKVDSWKVGDKKLDNEWEIAIREFSLEIDGKAILSMNPFEVTVNGVSQTGSIRRALLV